MNKIVDNQLLKQVINNAKELDNKIANILSKELDKLSKDINCKEFNIGNFTTLDNLRRQNIESIIKIGFHFNSENETKYKVDTND